jgi:outer membrane protein OmpA-like peptidoglycan-associated protein
MMSRFIFGARSAALAGACLAGALLSAPTAHAQVRPGSFEAGVFGGFWEGDEDIDNAGVFGARVAYNLSRVIGFEALYSAVPTVMHERVFGASGEIVDDITEDVVASQVGVNAILNLNSAMINPYLSGGAGFVALKGTHFAANVGLGSRVHITEEILAQVDVRGWFSGEAPARDQYAHFQATVGLGVQLGGEYDKDGDGITNTLDKCPTTAEDKDDFEDSDGCPEDDNDKDGIKDADDKCPMKPEDKDKDRDDDGCPDVDDDNDGIDNDADKCKDKPEDKDGFEDEDGCPEDDNDKDGIKDAADLCPNDAETKNNWADEDGCPEKDDDKDGIWNIVDQCADKPETLNGYKDMDGCADTVPADLTAILGIQPDIKFQRKSEAIFRRSLKPLDELAEVLKRYPGVIFEIHATAHGAKNNEELSNLRAAGVWTYLTSKGIGEQAIRAKGIGAAPLPADAPKGAKKDRIELRLFVPAKQPVPEAPSLEELKKRHAKGGKAPTAVQIRAEKAKAAAAAREAKEKAEATKKAGEKAADDAKKAAETAPKAPK